MLKNVAGQNITALLLDTNGAAVTTGTTTVYITADAGTQTSMGTATHEGNGEWSIDVTQAESNCDDAGFTWVNTGAVTVHQHVFTRDLPANFSDLSITATTGRVDVAAVAGTAQTANDNGNDINTLINRVIGTIAAGTHQPQSGDAYAQTNSGTIGLAVIEGLVDDLETRLTAARAGYLDELAAANIPADVDTLLARIIGTLAAGTHTAQTGDSFARIGATGSALTSLATQTSVDTIDANVDTMVAGIITGTAQTGTLTTTVATTDLTGYTADQLIGRLLTWTSGACDGEQTDITDYAVTNGTLTYTALTLAPGNGDTFKIT